MLSLSYNRSRVFERGYFFGLHFPRSSGDCRFSSPCTLTKSMILDSLSLQKGGIVFDRRECNSCRRSEYRPRRQRERRKSHKRRSMGYCIPRIDHGNDRLSIKSFTGPQHDRCSVQEHAGVCENICNRRLPQGRRSGRYKKIVRKNTLVR